jgi:hypothetical protein
MVHFGLMLVASAGRWAPPRTGVFPMIVRRSVPLSFLLVVLPGMLMPMATARAQVFVVTTEQYEGRFLNFTPTDVALPDRPASEKTRLALERALQSEQGFAMRPLPLASKGLTLHANGPLEPSAAAYVKELNEKGVAARPGDRVMITLIQFKPNKLVIEVNGGPDHKHKYLRHLEIGAGGMTAPVAQDDGEPVGSRLTLVFEHGVPDLSGDQVKALIDPVIGFKVKSPVEAYSQTLPPFLRKAVLEHHVLVGMSSDMVMHAVGQPTQKMRERDGQMPFEEWVYGTPPEHVQFVRFNHDRVIRVADADVGESPKIRASNEMGDYWSTQVATNERQIKLGDQTATDREQQTANPAPPSLRRPGETLPADKTNGNSSGPVQFPPKAPSS